MTTQELKQQIDKVLGNSIRCLLPSYWWKRLFNQVADRIDEVEQSTSQLIDSKVEEVKMPIVESVDELSKLDLPKGGVAAVEKVGEPVVVNLEDCYLSGDAATDWDKYTVIRGFSEKGAPSNSVGQIHLFSDKSMENGLTIACGEGKYYYYKIANGGSYYSSLEEVNEYLASGKYRLVFGYFIENISAYVTLYSQIPQPSLYIKSDSWEKLSKEYVVSSEEELNALNVENGTIARVAYDYDVRSYRNTKISNSTDKDFDRVVGLDVLSVPSSSFEITIYAQELEANNKGLSVMSYGTGRIDGVIKRREGNVIYQEEVYNLARDYSIKADGVKRFNELLRSMDCLLEHNSDVPEEFYAFIDSVLRFHIAVPVVSNVYIKGKTWDRLAKESDLEGIEGGSGEDNVVTFYAPIDNVSLSDTEKQHNAESYQKVADGFESDTYYDIKVLLSTSQLVALDVIKTINPASDNGRLKLIFGGVGSGIDLQMLTVTSDGSATTEKVEGGEGGSSITIDSELSDTSTNAVQNKVVTAAIEELKNSNAGIISRTVYPTKTVFFGIEQDNEISETEREYNCETFRMAANNVIQLKGDTNAVVPLLALTEESATFGLFKYQAVIGPEKMLIFASYVIDKDGNVIVEVEIAESEHLISTINEKADKSDIKTLNGVSLLGGGNLQLGDGQTFVYDDTELMEIAKDAKADALEAKALVRFIENEMDALAERVAELERIIQQQ